MAKPWTSRHKYCPTTTASWDPVWNSGGLVPTEQNHPNKQHAGELDHRQNMKRYQQRLWLNRDGVVAKGEWPLTQHTTENHSNGNEYSGSWSEERVTLVSIRTLSGWWRFFDILRTLDTVISQVWYYNVNGSIRKTNQEKWKIDQLRSGNSSIKLIRC